MDSDTLIPVKFTPRNHADQLAITCSVIGGVAWIAIALRFYTRIFIVRRIGKDDWTILVSLICLTCYCALCSYLGYLISGKGAISVGNLTRATNLLQALETFYIATIIFLKLSLGYLYLRIVINKNLRRAIQYILIIFIGFSGMYFFYAIFRCGLPGGQRLLWKKLSGSCASDASILGLGYTHAILTSTTDLFFLALVLPLLKDTKLIIREKIIVAALMSIATIGFVASLVRIKYIAVMVSHSLDFFHDGLLLGVWSTVEPGLGIIAISCITLRPLMRKFFDPILHITTRSHSRGDSKSNSRPQSPGSENLHKTLSEKNSYSSTSEKNVLNNEQFKINKDLVQVFPTNKRDSDQFKRYVIPPSQRQSLVSALKPPTKAPQRLQASQETWPGRRPGSAKGSYKQPTAQYRPISKPNNFSYPLSITSTLSSPPSPTLRALMAPTDAYLRDTASIPAYDRNTTAHPSRLVSLSSQNFFDPRETDYTSTISPINYQSDEDPRDIHSLSPDLQAAIETAEILSFHIPESRGPSTIMLGGSLHQHPFEFAPTTDASGRTSPVLSSVNGGGGPGTVPFSFDHRHLVHNPGDSLTWSERMEQAEQLNRERKVQRKIQKKIKKQAGLRPSSSRDGLSLGIYATTEDGSVGKEGSTASFWNGSSAGKWQPTTYDDADDDDEEGRRGRRMPRYHARVGSSHV